MMISSSKNNRGVGVGGFTLIEVLLAVGLCAILMGISVPTMAGWWSEHRLRTQADQLIKLVQAAKLQAERTGQPQVVVLLAPGEQPPEAVAKNVHFLSEEADTVWRLRKFGQDENAPSPSMIEIDRSGWVTPVSFRVTKGDKYMEYQFDFLTGHASESASSL